jgi:replication fork clamp-binding protein CrfC
VTEPTDPRKVNVINELIDHSIKIAELNNRNDLAERLTKARVRINDPQIRVVIAGQLKQGKSQLLNSLLGMAVARVGDDETTALATMVSYGEQSSARLIVREGDGAIAIDIAPGDIQQDLRRAPQANGREVLRVEVTAPSGPLKSGLAFVDTPGVGGWGQPYLAATLGLLPDADAMLMISDTSQEFTEPEMTFIGQAIEICPVAVIVATKTDLYPHWREIVHANTEHLRRAGITAPLIPASSSLRSHAVRLNDAELNEESNFPTIVNFLGRPGRRGYAAAARRRHGRRPQRD